MPGRRKVIPVLLSKDGSKAYAHPTKKSYTRSMRKPRVTRALTTAVNRLINRKIETKYVMYRPYSNSAGQLRATNFTQAINGAGEAYALIPPVQLGDGDHQRTGNVISPTSLTVKGFVALASNDPNSYNIDVDVYILRHKAIKDVAYQTQLGNFADLLNSGDGLNVGYDGSWTHSAMPINTSTYSLIAHKKIRLSKGWGDVNTALSGGSTSNASYEAGLKSQRNFSFKVKMPKKLQYKSDADTTPSMDYPFMVIGWNSPDNLDTTGSIMQIQATATTHMYYKDA